MGAPGAPRPVKLIAGLLAASAALLEEARQVLERTHGTIEASTPAACWDISDYYAREMGAHLLRQFVSFTTLIDPGHLATIKLETNALEQRWCRGNDRKVNIDPGYVGASKLVLATTKDAGHRIYLAGGIYAEPALRYESGSFRPYAHTYADYAAPEALVFFNQVRARYLSQLRRSHPRTERP